MERHIHRRAAVLITAATLLANVAAQFSFETLANQDSLQYGDVGTFCNQALKYACVKYTHSENP